MQQFVLNDEEIEHIRELRALPSGQKDAILRATHALSHTHPHLTLVPPGVVIKIHPRAAGA